MRVGASFDIFHCRQRGSQTVIIMKNPTKIVVVSTGNEKVIVLQYRSMLLLLVLHLPHLQFPFGST